jgi:4-hydroxybenzoate polyprenyltransferase
LSAAIVHGQRADQYLKGNWMHAPSSRLTGQILVDATIAGPEKALKPLCIDLDGTLVRTDSLIEGILSILSRRNGVANLVKAFTWSRAALKRNVAALANCSPELLPYNTELIAYLREMKSKGHRLILATAADARVAQMVADHVGLFDDVIACDGINNLKGDAKARELVRRFGKKGFAYAGNDRADLSVWLEADGIIIVNASSGVVRKTRSLGRVMAEFQDQPPKLITALRAMRPHQWVKNLLVFVPLLTSQSFTDWPGFLGALLMFASFCAAASGIYLANDLMDLEADRRHPRKRNRPFASGALELTFGIDLAVLLLAVSVALAAVAGAVHMILAYAAISLTYSLALKQYPVLDVFILAALYTLRIVAGGIASLHPASLWLLAFAGFMFLSLALVKRCGELPRELRDSDVVNARRGYCIGDRPLLVMFGVGSAFASSVVLALYVGSTTAVQQYPSPEALWSLVPLCLFWQLRLWLSTERGNMHDDPIVYASRDWVSRLVAIGVVAIVLLASWGVRFW